MGKLLAGSSEVAGSTRQRLLIARASVVVGTALQVLQSTFVLAARLEHSARQLRGPVRERLPRY